MGVVLPECLCRITLSYDQKEAIKDVFGTDLMDPLSFRLQQLAKSSEVAIILTEAILTKRKERKRKRKSEENILRPISVKSFVIGCDFRSDYISKASYPMFEQKKWKRN